MGQVTTCPYDLGAFLIIPRKLNRLQKFNYSDYGFYFVTLCADNREKWFGNIKNNEMTLSECGKIVKKQWLWMEKQYSYVKLDAFIIMPNHVHGIIFINNPKNNINSTINKEPVGTGRDLSHNDLSLRRKIKSLSELIGAFKTTSSKLIHLAGQTPFAWQRSFYDHIIRSEKSLESIRQYVIYNHLKWAEDIENGENLKNDANTIKSYYNAITG